MIHFNSFQNNLTSIIYARNIFPTGKYILEPNNKLGKKEEKCNSTPNFFTL